MDNTGAKVLRNTACRSNRRHRARAKMCAPSIDEPVSIDPSVVACSQEQWLPKFRSHALRTAIVELPVSFLEYLQEDGVFLGAASEAVRDRGHPSDGGPRAQPCMSSKPHHVPFSHILQHVSVCP